MRVEVTAEDIANGKRNRCKACPIALALVRLGFVDPSIKYGRVYGRFGKGYRPLPLEACEFIFEFDIGRPVEPFSFDIED